MVISDEQRKQAEKILEGLMTQTFFEWHENKFNDYVQDGSNGNKKEILEDIVVIFNIK